MQINVNFLDNLRLEANFDDFTITTDQPVRYKGDGTAPSPFDYFLASSALCAAYFVKVYCIARNISTHDIKLKQNNIVDPENRYQQIFQIEVELPENISARDKEGILKSIERCTVKKVIQASPDFKIIPKDLAEDSSNLMFDQTINLDSKTMIKGKDSSLEETILKMSTLLKEIGISIEIASWRNLVPHVWSVHIRDADSPLCYTNGKGATKDAALCSALGEYIERISNNYFYNDYFLGEEMANKEFVHYPNEKWFIPENNEELPSELMDKYLKELYNPENELRPEHLIDTNSGNRARGICALPFVRQSDQETVFIPVNLIGNLFVSNGMSAGNSKYEARVQSLSEIFERAVKNEIIINETTLPDVPKDVLNRFPKICEGIEKLEAMGFPIIVKDASLGGRYPVMCVTLMNPKNGGVFASFGAHPNFEIALERSLTELLQGRSIEGLNDLFPPTFNEFAIKEHNNIIDHFIDSTGVISWKFFSDKFDYDFFDWNFSGSTEEEYHYLMNIFKELDLEVYISDYNELGASACRILVPNYSEIYHCDDLIWDNHNKSLKFRSDILNIHDLGERELKNLLKKMDENEIDDYTLISELIGIAFEETSVWGQLNVIELKALIYLSISDFEASKEMIEMLVTFNDNTAQRKQFFQLLNIALEIEINEELDYINYKNSLVKMYGHQLISIVEKSLTGEIKFYGLTKTDMKLSGIDKHIKLIESYEKLHKIRKEYQYEK